MEKVSIALSFSGWVMITGIILISGSLYILGISGRRDTVFCLMGAFGYRFI
jgi:uncharacterized membrane protein YgdD (TMEM256/DUF423 family)